MIQDMMDVISKKVLELLLSYPAGPSLRDRRREQTLDAEKIRAALHGLEKALEFYRTSKPKINGEL